MDCNSVTNKHKLTGNNPNLDLVNINTYVTFGDILSISYQKIEQKEILTLINSYNSVTNVLKMMHNNPNIGLVYINAYVTRHAKRYELGGRRHFEKMRLKVNVALRKNSTPKRVSKRSLTSYKTGPKTFFMLGFSANTLSNILYDIKCDLLNVRKLKLGRESSMQFSLWLELFLIWFK